MTTCLRRVGLLLLLVTLSCVAKDTDVYFDSFANCGQTNTVDADSQVTVHAERNPDLSSSSFSTCEILFKASGLDDALCLQIDQLYFKNGNLKLNFFDAQEASGNTPTRVFSDDSSDLFSVPMEICSTGRYATLSLAQKSSGMTASIKDVDINIKVRNMHGNRRTVYLDTDCGTVSGMRLVDESQLVVVRSRHSDRTADLPALCQAVFKYIGEEKNKTVCLQYLPKQKYCNFKLKVLDGNLTAFSPSHTYSCTNDQPQTYCSSGRYLTLEMMREASFTASLEPDDLFIVNVKDGVKGKKVFPDPPNPWKWWQILLIVLGVIAVILIPIVCYCVLKSKGRHQNEVSMQKL